MEIKIVVETITNAEIAEIAKNQFGNFVKAVVDVEKEIMAIGSELHADGEAFLIERGSLQRNLWGINIYHAKNTDERIEFDSMINVRPTEENYSRGVENPAIREKIAVIVQKLVKI